MVHVDAVLKIMSVLTQDSRFEEAQNKGKGEMSMCEVLDKVEKKGIEQGLQQGLQQGITILVDSLKELNQTNESSFLKLWKNSIYLKQKLKNIFHKREKQAFPTIIGMLVFYFKQIFVFRYGNNFNFVYTVYKNISI